MKQFRGCERKDRVRKQSEPERRADDSPFQLAQNRQAQAAQQGPTSGRRDAGESDEEARGDEPGLQRRREIAPEERRAESEKACRVRGGREPHLG